jgi:hypothetical protein
MQQMQNQTPVAAVEDIPAKLKQLKDLFDAGVLDEEEFKSKKSDLLSKL